MLEQNELRGATTFGTGNYGRRSTIRRYWPLSRIAPSSCGVCNSTPWTQITEGSIALQTLSQCDFR